VVLALVLLVVIEFYGREPAVGVSPDQGESG
jgi:hypothetical protein